MSVLWQKILGKKEIFLGLFIVLSLFFPAFYSVFDVSYMSIYYAGFSWPYLMAGIYLALLFASRENRGKMGLFLWSYLALVFLYNLLSLYFNMKYLHWYWEQVNNTLAFLLFGAMVCYGPGKQKWEERQLRFLICCIMGSVLCGILFDFTGETGIYFINNRLQFAPFDNYESRNYWIYSHKSDYALLLLLFMAMFLRWKDAFTGRWRLVPWLGIGMIIAAMVQTHSWTGIVGMLLVLAGALLDRVDWKRFKRSYLWGLLAIGSASIAVLGKISEERDIFSLGSRLPIWKGALEVIKKYPEGWGMRFGDSLFYAGDTGWMVNNAHNVFLNAVLRFSIPVGICFTVLLVTVMIYTIIKARSLLVAGMWAGVFLLMNMDYALQNNEIAMMLFLVYLVCLPEPRKGGRPGTETFCC